MNLDFAVENVRTTEFGVGLDEGDGQSFRYVAVDPDVQVALREMIATTWQAMHEMNDNPPTYDPSERYGSTDYILLPLDHDLARPMRELHQADNLPVDGTALSDPAKVFCYFARVTDSQGRRLTALRRATQFKGVLKSRLIRLVTDALRIVEDKVFKLDTDFDLLIDGANVHILRPSGFEFAGKLQEAILAAVPETVKAIQRDLKFVDFAGIQKYASKHPRAARYLASIHSQKEAKNINKAALKKACKDNGVEVHEARSKLTVVEDQVMDFLEVLDRRRYELQLIKGSPERFRAASRRKIES